MNLVTYITPLNLSAEKEKFFASSSYHPQFQYCWDQPQAEDWLDRHPLYQPLGEAMKNQDLDGIIDTASHIFDTRIDLGVLKAAQQIVSVAPEKLPPQTLEQVSQAFADAFTFLGLDEYQLEIVDQHGFNFRPAPSEKKIVASQYMSLDFFSIDGEVKHELAHIIRWENGLYNSVPMAKDYLPTEEGLACYCHDYTGEFGHSSLFQHAAEYAMTEVALKASLRETVEYLQGVGFSKELAWQRAVRHKYGFIDSSLPGDIMKPSMYFFHQQLVKQLTPDERYRLFVGKISSKQLQNFRQYVGRVPLATLQEFYPWPDRRQ